MLFYTYQYKSGEARMLLQVILLFCKKVSNVSPKTQEAQIRSDISSFILISFCLLQQIHSEEGCAS